jgi:Mce-associated membrane protein
VVSTAVGDETTQDMVDDAGSDIDDPIAGSDPDNARSPAAADDPPPGEDQLADAGAGGGGRRWVRVVAYGLLPAVAFVLAGGAGYLKWQGDSARDAVAAQSQSVAAATEGTIALLSYQAGSVDKQLTAARDGLTGTFRDSYSALIHDVVIPGAQQKQISAVATVPAAASVSATGGHAVVLVFVDQSVTVGADAPTSTASSVKVTLDKIGGRWLISDFTPV